MRSGDFSAITRQLRNPFTGQPFPGNQIPVALFNPAAREILDDWIPLPNPGAGDSPLTLKYRQAVESADHQYLGRLDHRFSGNHSLYGRFWVSRASTPPVLEDGNAINSAFGRTWQNTIASVNDSYVISPRVVNNLVVTFNRTNNYNFHILPPDYGSLGITDVYNDDAPQWFFNVSGYFGINTGDTNTFLRNEFQVVNTTRWSLGKHDLAFGADYAYGQGDIVNNFRANGRYTFNGSAPFSGDALADFMLGKFSSFEQGIGEYKNTRMHSIALFVQDNFRVNSKLTAEPRRAVGSVHGVQGRDQPHGVLPSWRRVAGLHQRADWRRVSRRRPVSRGRLRRRLAEHRPAPRVCLRSLRRRPHERPGRLRRVLRSAEHHRHQLGGQPGPVRHRHHVPRRREQLPDDDLRGPHQPVPGRSLQRAERRRVRAAAPDVQLLGGLRERDDADVAPDGRAGGRADLDGARRLRGHRAAATCRSAAR